MQSDKIKNNLKRKFVEEENIPPDYNQLWKMHGIQTNYHYLNNPFSDEEEANTIDNQLTSAEQIFTAFANTLLEEEELKSLEEAKQSPEWPEWEHTVQTELAQLQEKGT
jgi:protein subunit release factor A